jgi:hypothetical protein
MYTVTVSTDDWRHEAYCGTSLDAARAVFDAMAHSTVVAILERDGEVIESYNGSGKPLDC